jgi:hypothetical protein
MKREITLKDLAAYLPYGLKYQLHGNFPIKEGEENYITDISEISPFDNTLKKVLFWNTCKPILRPISEVDTDIMHKGKKVNVLNIMCDYWECEWNGVTNEFELPFKNLTIEFSSHELPYMLVDILLEYHFDVFGLIDDNLAIPVTKDFNPYE